MMYGLGIASLDRTIYLFSKTMKPRGKSQLQLSSSSDGVNFQTTPDTPVIRDEKSGKEESIKKCKDFRISKLNGEYVLTYKKFTRGDKYKINGAVSNDLKTWKGIGKLSKIDKPGVVVPNYTYKRRYVMYFGEGEIKVGFSKSLKRWTVIDKPVLGPRGGYFDNLYLEVVSCSLTDKGIYLVYTVKDGAGFYHSAGAAIFDKKDPVKMLWRSEHPVWRRAENWKDKAIYPMGIVHGEGKSIFYWVVSGEGIRAVVLTPTDLATDTVLKNFEGNPIIEPVHEHPWESVATFNPAAVEDGDKTHILYRAVGNTHNSVIGYASSKDGTNIDERLKDPIFVHSASEGGNPHKPNPISIPFFSPRAGWCGGCEDPRVTKIGDTLYMTFVSFDGCSPPRVALTSIKMKDFRAKKWNWTEPVLISPPGIVNKNAVIFPEKVKDKYVIFHRVFPSILIDFVDDLNFDGKTKFLEGHYSIDPRVGYWDSRKLGAGASPIKTKDGWLLIYQGVDDLDPHYRYRIGAMLLDPNDPTRILYRCKKPILEPGWGDDNIAYPCGAVVKRDKLFVYYGSADVRVKVASAELGAVIDALKDSGEPKIMPISFLNL